MSTTIVPTAKNSLCQFWNDWNQNSAEDLLAVSRALAGSERSVEIATNDRWNRRRSYGICAAILVIAVVLKTLMSR